MFSSQRTATNREKKERYIYKVIGYIYTKGIYCELDSNAKRVVGRVEGDGTS